MSAVSEAIHTVAAWLKPGTSPKTDPIVRLDTSSLRTSTGGEQPTSEPSTTPPFNREKLSTQKPTFVLVEGIYVFCMAGTCGTSDCTDIFANARLPQKAVEAYKLALAESNSGSATINLGAERPELKATLKLSEAAIARYGIHEITLDLIKREFVSTEPVPSDLRPFASTVSGTIMARTIGHLSHVVHAVHTAKDLC